MKQAAVASILVLLLIGCSIGNKTGQKTIENIAINQNDGVNVRMKLTSTAFSEGDMIPAKYTCQGENINPPLKWEEVPEGTKSFALIFDDPDAKQVVGYTWVHWLVKDIPADVTEIKENSVPGTEVVNSFGRGGYGGPCPPALHRYFFKLYALDAAKLDAENKNDFYKKVEEHKIEETVLMGRYAKS